MCLKGIGGLFYEKGQQTSFYSYSNKLRNSGISFHDCEIFQK